MKYRTHKKTGDKISEIGMGTAYLFEAGMAEGVRALQRAYEGGINSFDLAAGHGDAYPIFGEAFGGAGGVRNNVLYQIHFGTEYTKGEYGWTLDLDMIKRSIDEQLALLKTDYIDYGFIHCLDTIADWNHAFAIEIKSTSQADTKSARNLKKYLELKGDDQTRAAVFYLGKDSFKINGIDYVSFNDWDRYTAI